ncbi:MAG TPA: bifunctional diaminohydroxyphosphoribosylaminopyrimidine deaminase/5-amino-6-(5-phosphoribosylamino)uracil reductase RibD [Verrucomicrobiae bacterium]|nr:bifunctional diaminohydroxyphosphoribosylaminopyrimidine deaminase/5-amino-6-(5-phosphoribosylamino)uracil reductase RibD [Verrucomicrobiae bacterium]
MNKKFFMRLALQLAKRGHGLTSPNPMVGAILVKRGKIIGRGWHRRAGEPHAEIEALRDAEKHRQKPAHATLYVTLEPCCTHGRTPPCTDAIIAARIKRVVVGAMDPNPMHAGKGFEILRRAGIEMEHGILADECERLNESFNHWIVHRTPFVMVKAAMTLDGKIATAAGESKWITGEKAREHAMTLRRGADAILVGVNTILADNPSLTLRTKWKRGKQETGKPVRRIVLDSLARTPLDSKVVTDSHAAFTTIVVSKRAKKSRVAKLKKRVKVVAVPLINSKLKTQNPNLNLRRLMKILGAENVTSLLVEGGGEVNASFLSGGLAQRVAFFYAPKILGGADSRKAVAGAGVVRLQDAIQLRNVEWRKFGSDLFMTARISK